MWFLKYCEPVTWNSYCSLWVIYECVPDHLLETQSLPVSEAIDKFEKSFLRIGMGWEETIFTNIEFGQSPPS